MLIYSAITKFVYMLVFSFQLAFYVILYIPLGFPLSFPFPFLSFALFTDLPMDASIL